MPDIEVPVLDPQLPPARPKWRKRVREVLVSLHGTAPLQQIYEAVAKAYPESLERKHWKAKVRQTLQEDPEIESRGGGVWRLVDITRHIDRSNPKPKKQK